jgi:hypothetical protein
LILDLIELINVDESIMLQLGLKLLRANEGEATLDRILINCRSTIAHAIPSLISLLVDVLIMHLKIIDHVLLMKNGQVRM